MKIKPCKLCGSKADPAHLPVTDRYGRTIRVEGICCTNESCKNWFLDVNDFISSEGQNVSQKKAIQIWNNRYSIGMKIVKLPVEKPSKEILYKPATTAVEQLEL